MPLFVFRMNDTSFSFDLLANSTEYFRKGVAFCRFNEQSWWSSLHTFPRLFLCCFTIPRKRFSISVVGFFFLFFVISSICALNTA